MSAFKLADGSISSDYRVGDEFTVESACAPVSIGQIVSLKEDDSSAYPFFGGGFYENSVLYWYKLSPTPETKRKVAERKMKQAESPSELEMHRMAYDMIQDAGFESPEELLAAYKELSEKEPLAHFVDWREVNKKTDVAVLHKADGRFKIVPVSEFLMEDKAVDDTMTIIRINTDFLPKKRTMTVSEAEEEFGIKIVGE